MRNLEAQYSIALCRKKKLIAQAAHMESNGGTFYSCTIQASSLSEHTTSLKVIQFQAALMR